MNRRDAILNAVRRIPAGCVSTYGDVAAFAGLRGAAREVGWALAGLPEDDVPWWRVVNCRGRSSLPAPYDDEQTARLRAEGVPVTDAGRLSLSRHRWQGPGEKG